jgi:RHS repeat-associated protein
MRWPCYFTSLGQTAWKKDPDGFIDYTAYDLATGAPTEEISDVNTAITSDFTNLPSGWSTNSGGGLNLLTSEQVDALGRDTREVDPAGVVNYLVYNDPNHQERIYPGWTGSTTTGPTQMVREDLTGTYSEQLTMTATPAVSGGQPTGTEAVSSIQSLDRQLVDNAGQQVTDDQYFNLANVAYSVASAVLGTAGTNYYGDQEQYNNVGETSETIDQSGTIDKTTYDGLRRPVARYEGTSDANLVQVEADVYDGGGVGDGNLTQVTLSPLGGAADRVTQNFFDWRDRLVVGKDGVQGTEDTTTHRPITYNVYDNLNQVVTEQQYDGDGVTILTTGGLPQAPSASLLRAETLHNFDEQGREYLTQTYSVNQSTGALSSSTLNTNVWYSHRGQVLKTAAPGGLVTKTQYDGDGRVTAVYLTDGGGDTTWADAGNVTGDNVLQQTETTYNAEGSPTLTVTRQRNHDEAATGSLGNPTTSPKTRVSYVASYYDNAGRLAATADFGTGGGSAPTAQQLATVPFRTDTVLVTSYTYNPAGQVDTVTDPRNLVTKTLYDNEGRTSQTIQAYTGGAPTPVTNRTTSYTYDHAGHVLTVTVAQPGGTSQITKFVYGVTTPSSAVNSADLLAAVQYPDKGTGQPSASEQETYTYNGQGQVNTFTDRNGNVHTYSYDVLGRQTVDAITMLGTGVDNGVLRAETAYDTQDNAYLFTTYNAASGGSIVNQVQDAFNGLGQLTTEYQSHSGAVNTGTTPNIQYGYTVMAGGVNNSRPITLTYPNGRVLNDNYNAGLDSTLSRLSSISDSSATLEAYTYLGLNTVVDRSHPQPGVDLTYIKQSGESNGDAGDQYTGLNRFGRVVDQRWIVTANGTHTDRFQYGYDRDSSALYKNNLVNSANSELYHPSGVGQGYDPTNELTGFARGTLSMGSGSSVLDTVSSPSRTQGWTTDALGNFTSVTTNGVAQTRTYNQQNQVSGVGAAALVFDKNGNTTVDDHGNTLTYDAWNRLVQVKAPGGATLSSYTHDALGRRIIESTGGITSDLYYSAAGQVLEERVSNQAKVQYVWSPVYVDALVERDRDADGNPANGLEERLYVQQDANWNVTALLNTSGAVVERYVYDPYGQVTYLSPSWSAESGSSYAWIYQFQGLRLDTAVGIYSARARTYSPTLGRWLEADPLGFGAGDTNFYRVVGDNPTNRTDPTGLYEDDVHFYMTYYIALAVGLGDYKTGFHSNNRQGKRIRFSQAFMIAWADAYTDMHDWTEPFQFGFIKSGAIWGGVIGFFLGGGPGGAVTGAAWGAYRGNKKAAYIRENFHFPLDGKGKVTKNSPEALSWVRKGIRENDPILTGIALHRYQDSWSHKGYEPFLGHGEDRHWPDQAWHRMRHSMEMAKATFDVLVDYMKQNHANAAQAKLANPKALWAKIKPTLEDDRRFVLKGVGWRIGRAGNRRIRVIKAHVAWQLDANLGVRVIGTAALATQADVHGDIGTSGNVVMRVPAPRHRIHDPSEVLVLEGRCQFSGEVVFDRYQIEFACRAHAVSLSRNHAGDKHMAARVKGPWQPARLEERAAAR